MIYLRCDIQQVHRSLWRGYIQEYDVHVSAASRSELIDEFEREVTESYLGSGTFTLIVTTC